MVLCSIHLCAILSVYGFICYESSRSAQTDANLIFTVFGGKFCFKQVLKNRASRVER